jgi:hypothetical protein
MFDYAYGGLDEELLTALHGDHLAACTSCRRAVDVYTSYRPGDPARFSEVPEFAGALENRDEYGLSPGDAGRKLRDYIAADSGPLLVVAGEANPEVYDPELGQALRERVRRSGPEELDLPKFVCGPAMGLNDRIPTKDDAVLPNLAEEGLVELFISEHRQTFHFRVSGENHVYTEEYHRAGDMSDRKGYWYASRSLAAMLDRRFRALLEAGKVRPARRGDFVYLPMKTIRRIETSGDTSFDGMTAKDLALWLGTQDAGRSSPSE